MGSIILNTFVLMFKWFDQPESISTFTEIINYLFAFIFTAEAIIKIAGLGASYFKDGWNKFDLLIVIGTLSGITLQLFLDIKLGPQTTIIRSFRIFRIFRLIKRAKSLQMMIQTFIFTLPSLANIGGLLMLILYLYSIIGMNLFGTIMRSYPLHD
jgi:hypothetical protein